jgi:hypothetical protein
MARTHNDNIRRSRETAAHEPDLAAVGIANLDPLLHASNRIFECWMAVGSELLEFGKAQLDHSLAIGKALTQSGSLNEAIDLQSKYAQTVVQEYVNEASKIVDLGTRTVLESMSQLQPQAGAAQKHAEAAE